MDPFDWLKLLRYATFFLFSPSFFFLGLEKREEDTPPKELHLSPLCRYYPWGPRIIGSNNVGASPQQGENRGRKGEGKKEEIEKEIVLHFVGVDSTTERKEGKKKKKQKGMEMDGRTILPALPEEVTSSVAFYLRD